ncbi:MAG TPA: hypothetical protein DD400_00930 [Rhodospirillaceae bacterium]|nr:hypothetical protein [Rhodospirillaceae bacterium]
MRLRNEDDAKKYTCEYTVSKLSLKEAQQRINNHKKILENTTTDEDRAFWQEQITGLEEYIKSEDLKTGTFPQSIDTVLFETVEWSALLSAFHNPNINESTFFETAFFQRWQIGAIYVILSNIAKLLSKKNGDHSLTRLWKEVSPFLKNHIAKDEFDYIRRKLDHPDGQALKLRHEVVAHNVKSTGIHLDLLDEELKFIARVWSIITIWSTFPMLFPWQEQKNALSGLDKIFSAQDIRQLKVNRDKYIRTVEEWCKTNLVTSEIERRSPFGEPSIKITTSASSS